MCTVQTTLEWPALNRKGVKRFRSERKPAFVAVVGGSGAGKTWLSVRLQETIGKDAAVLSLDSFYKDLSHKPLVERGLMNFDSPRAIDWGLFHEAMRTLVRGEATHIPRYDFTSHSRLAGLQAWTPRSLVIVEGLWLLHTSKLRTLFDLKIYLDCDEELRFERRKTRDIAERGRTPEEVGRQFQDTVQPMHRRFVEVQRRWADIVLKHPWPQDAVEALTQRVWSLTTQDDYD